MLRSRFDGYKRVSVSCSGVSRTKQSFKDECDINTILLRYKKTGQLPGLIKSNPQYGDFSDVRSYQDALHTVMFAQEQFSGLSASVRARFDNDPSLFLAFVENPDNRKEMIDLGLVNVSSDTVVPGLVDSVPKDSDVKKVKSSKVSSSKDVSGSVKD